MKYYVRVNGRDHEVELVERLGQLVVSVGGRPLDVDYYEVDRGQVSLLHGRESFAVSIENASSNEFSITIAGHSYEIEIEDERERAAHAAARAASKGGGVQKSVMPGIVVQLLVEPGDLVTAGQPLLILEAMKMQNEICAGSAGRVGSVHVSSGQAVAGGAKLLTILAAEDASGGDEG